MLKPLSLLLLLNVFCQPVLTQAQRLIHSGFESGVTITSDLDNITGVDQSTGYDWSSNPSWIESSRFVYLIDKDTPPGRFQDSKIIETQGPHGNTTRVLQMTNIGNDPAHGSRSRNEYSLFGHRDDSGENFKEGYVRYWMKLDDIASRIPFGDYSKFYMIMEWKEGDSGNRYSTAQCQDCCDGSAGGTNNYRTSIYIRKERNESVFRWRIKGEQVQPCRVGEWSYTNPTEYVIFDEWFLVEAYFRKDAADGRLVFAINGRIVLDTDQTKPEGFTGRTQHASNPLPLKFWSPMKNYFDHEWSEEGPISQYYDDFELWEQIPDNAFTQQEPARDHIWLEAECGNVGSTWEEKSDSNASGSSYVEIAPGNNSMSSAPDSASDRIDHQFEVNKSGDYHLWGRLRTPSPSDDSFWIKVDDGPWSIWYTGVFTEWGWKKQRTHSLSADTHQLSIAYREDGAQLDKLYLTSGSATPVATGPTGSFNCNAANAFPDPAKWYYLENKACAGNGQPERLDTDNCTRVDVDPGTAQDKQWRFALSPDGNSYYVINRACGSRLDADDCQTVDLSDGGVNDDQRWLLTLSDDGVHYLLNNKACGGKNLDTDNCGNVKVAGGNQNDKRWKLVEAGSVNAREAESVDKEVSEAIPAGELLIYPNPAQQTLQLRVLDHLPPGQLTLHDLQGRVVLQQNLSGSQTIDVAHLPPGLYTVRLQLGDTVETRKIVIGK